MKVYLAGPLFSIAERQFNTSLANAVSGLDRTIDVLLPQDRVQQFIGRPNQNRAIFDDCLAGVREADVVVAVLEGADADSGTAVEIGYALAIGKPILGLRTDMRISEERGLNLMLAFGCTELVLALDASIDDLATRVVAFVHALPT